MPVDMCYIGTKCISKAIAGMLTVLKCKFIGFVGVLYTYFRTVSVLSTEFEILNNSQLIF